MLQDLEKTHPSNSAAPSPVSWGYGQGPNGPTHWGNLSAEFALCSDGRLQSPINIETGVVSADLPPLRWQLDGAGPLRLRASRGNGTLAGREAFDGHAFEVEGLRGPVISVDGQDYCLQELRFHTPSEHTVAGRHLDAELQLVHVRRPTTEMLDGDGDAMGRVVGGAEPRLVVAAFLERVRLVRRARGFRPRGERRGEAEQGGGGRGMNVYKDGRARHRILFPALSFAAS
jgi:hypothetical protein